MGYVKITKFRISLFSPVRAWMKQKENSAWANTLKYFRENQPDDYRMWLINLNFISFKNQKYLKLSVGNPLRKSGRNSAGGITAQFLLPVKKQKKN